MTFPELRTTRLCLRKIQPTDSDMIWFLRSDPIVTQYIKRTKTKSREEAEAFIERINTEMDYDKSVSWAIVPNQSEALIGTICLWNFSEDRKTAEVGYDLSPSHHKNGYMNEAMQRVLAYGFDELQLQKIEAFTHKNNQSSIRLLEKNGFRQVPERKDEDNPDNAIFELERREN